MLRVRFLLQRRWVPQTLLLHLQSQVQVKRLLPSMNGDSNERKERGRRCCSARTGDESESWLLDRLEVV